MSAPERVRVIESIAEVSSAAWDALPAPDNPFVEHAFLRALEESGSVGPGTGWLPVHLLVEDASGELLGAMPLYLKEHSYGEYIFDWAWANGAQRAGLDYYPKLVSAVPFTPATGPRLLQAPEAGPEVFTALRDGALALAQRAGASSVHWLFTPGEQARQLCRHPRIHYRMTYQYHWKNDGFEDFADFLSRFRSKTRKQVRRERRKAASCGLELRTLRGAEVEGHLWDQLHPLYRSTIRKKGAIPYLSPEFFALLPERLAHRVLLTGALENGELVAAALSFTRGQHLYGRYWGCHEAHEALHFELCYYRPLEWAIEQGLRRVEAGAQGPHKIRRGFLPTATHSAHWIAHPGLSDAVARFLQSERAHHRQELDLLDERSPFRRGPKGG